MTLHRGCAIVLCAACFAMPFADPELTMSGYLDSDVWTDFLGSFYTNHELDVGWALAFNDKVSAHVYATMRAGMVPARYGRPGDRWGSVAFDGFDITMVTPAGTITAGDLVYQYGKFNYYFYKRQSMITPENFTRGVSWSFTAGKLTQTILAGAADNPDVLVQYSLATTSGDTVQYGQAAVQPANNGDLSGVSALAFGDGLSLALYYGCRSDIAKDFNSTGLFFGGLECTVNLGEAIKVKADIGYRNQPLAGDRANTIALLLEPSLAIDKFTTTATAYYFVDKDESGANPVDDQFFAYLEPGYAFTDVVALGLPLEIHSGADATAMNDAGAFWAVPTLYVYPATGVQWWIWGQMVRPFNADADPGWGFGSEVIVTF